MTPEASTPQPDLSRAAIPAEYVQLGEAVAAAYLESGCTWPLNKLALRIAAVAKIAADRREDEVRQLLDPRKCAECDGDIPARIDDGEDFCSTECEDAYDEAHAADCAHDTHEARLLGEVA